MQMALPGATSQCGLNLLGGVGAGEGWEREPVPSLILTVVLQEL